MRLIDADAMRQDLLQNGWNESIHDTNVVLESIDGQPTIGRCVALCKAMGLPVPDFIKNKNAEKVCD